MKNTEVAKGMKINRKVFAVYTAIMFVIIVAIEAFAGLSNTQFALIGIVLGIAFAHVYFVSYDAIGKRRK